MSLNGKYQLVRNEGLLEHVVANGMPLQHAKKIVEDTNDLDISISGDDVKVSSTGPDQNLKLNQETSSTAPDGRVFKNTTSLNGNILTVVSKVGSHEWKRIYELSGCELTVTSKSSKSGVPDGKRIYRRI